MNNIIYTLYIHCIHIYPKFINPIPLISPSEPAPCAQLGIHLNLGHEGHIGVILSDTG